jgi:hypothetical protein
MQVSGKPRLDWHRRTSAGDPDVSTTASWEDLACEPRSPPFGQQPQYKPPRKGASTFDHCCRCLLQLFLAICRYRRITRSFLCSPPLIGCLGPVIDARLFGRRSKHPPILPNSASSVITNHAETCSGWLQHPIRNNQNRQFRGQTLSTGNGESRTMA